MGHYPDIDPLDWATIQPEVERLLGTSLSPERVDAWLLEWSSLGAVLYESAAGIQRAVSENTADQEAEQRFLRLVEEIMPRLRVAEQDLRDRLLNVDGYRPSSETASLYQRFQAEASLFRPENVPLETELAKLANQYDKVAGALSIQWDGVSETMQQAARHLQDRNRATRERAWHLIMDRWLQERGTLNELYLKMLALRRQVAANAGKKDYREYAWQARQRFDYTPEDSLTFHEAIACEVTPAAERLYNALAEQLGLQTLRPWDTDVDPNAEPLRPFASIAELEEGAYRMLQHVDPEMAEYFAAMRDGWLDLGSRPNKAPGGYCESFPVSRKAYIFANAVGTQEDVRTLLHESGHSFHFMESLVHPLIWNHGGPPEFAEVASMGMELLAAPYLERSQGGFYDATDARRAYREQLERIVRFLPYMAVVDAFQHWVYTAAPQDVTADQLDAQWSTLWDRFTPGVDYRGLEDMRATGWHRKLHIFQIPFYYVEYGMAQVGALQVWRNALGDQRRAVADYRGALRLGYTRSLPELYGAAGARFVFDRQMLSGLMELIGEQIGRLGG